METKKALNLVLTYVGWHTTTYIGVVRHFLNEEYAKIIQEQGRSNKLLGNLGQ
jgi:hypothetical protein